MVKEHGPVDVVVKDIAIGVGIVLGSISQAGEMGHRRQRLATAATFPCCSGAKPRRWAPPLVTRFGVMLRLKKKFDS